MATQWIISASDGAQAHSSTSVVEPHKGHGGQGLLTQLSSFTHRTAGPMVTTTEGDNPLENTAVSSLTDKPNPQFIEVDASIPGLSRIPPKLA